MGIIPFDSPQHVVPVNGDTTKLAAKAEASVGTNGDTLTTPLEGDPSTTSGKSPPSNGHDPYPLYPESLKVHPAFVGWNPETFDKKPINLHTLKPNASSNRPPTWSTYEHAISQVCSTVGLGREILEGEAVIEFDYVRDSETGKIEDWALAVIRELNSFTEISPSGRGLHVHVNHVWTLPDKHSVKKNRPNGWSGLVRGVMKHEGIEIHGRMKPTAEDISKGEIGEGQYFTISGLHFPETPLTVETRDLSSLIERVQNLSVFGAPKQVLQNEEPTSHFIAKKTVVGDGKSDQIHAWLCRLVELIGADHARVRLHFDLEHGADARILGSNHYSSGKWESRNVEGIENADYIDYSIVNAMLAVAKKQAEQAQADIELEDDKNWIDSTLPGDNDLEAWKQRATDHVTSFSRPTKIHDDFYRGSGCIGYLAEILERASDLDPIAVAAQCSVFFGNVFGWEPNIFSGQKPQRCNLYVGVIGPTTLGRKGSGLSLLLELFKRLEGAKDWSKLCIERGLSTGEGLVHRIRDPRTVDEDDAENGHEKGDKDPGVEDKRVLFLEEEFPAVLQKSRKRNDGSLFGKVCEAYDSPDFMGVGPKKGAIRASDPHVSIIGQGTVPYLNQVVGLTDISGGFCNRFLWIWSTMTQALLDARVPEILLQPFLSQAADAITFAASVKGEMTRTEDAQRLMEIEFFKSIALHQAGLLSDLLARQTAIVNRLSMIFALVNCSKVIKVEHVRAALALFDYSAHCATLIFASKLGGLDDQVLQVLRNPEHVGGLTRTQIWKALNLSHHGSTVALLKVLQNLEKAGLIRREGSGRGEKWFDAQGVR